LKKSVNVNFYIVYTPFYIDFIVYTILKFQK